MSLKFPENCCQHCPTKLGHIYGHDPESFELLKDAEFCKEQQQDGSHLYCPWRKADCAAYPVEISWAIEYHDRGETPPVKLHKKYG